MAMTTNELERNAMPHTNAAIPLPTWLTCHQLDVVHRVYSGRLPPDLLPSQSSLDALWELHPSEFPDVTMFGRKPDLLDPLLSWCTEQLEPRLNGLLVNWYDAALEHHITPHHDKTTDLVKGAPIVTISLGAERVFRMRMPDAGGRVLDLAATHGAVFVMPFDTNEAWKHLVPHRARDRGRRISVTVRAFEDSSAPRPARMPR
jgi:hypothetical protein